MLKKIIAIVLLVIIVSGVVACSSSSQASATPIKAKWLEPKTTGDAVSIPVSDVVKNRIVHFRLNAVTGRPAFMAYQFNKETIVRSNICPPCRSIGFSLEGNELVCDTCGTRFSAKSGEGIAGPCVAYPKAPVAFSVAQNEITMTQNNLLTAYQQTLKPGLN